jgi:hypothetical protein
MDRKMMLAEIPWQILTTPLGIPIVAIVSVFSWLIVDSISVQVGKVIRHRADHELKLELLAQGRDSEEIARIVAAGREPDDGDIRHRHRHRGAGLC